MATNVTLFFSDFETNRTWDYTSTNTDSLSLLSGVYTNGEVVDGWQVISNAVCIAQDPTNANSGSNFLSLGNGLLARDVDTVIGKPYRLTYAYRGQGLTNWWPADSKVNDLIGLASDVASSDVTYTNGNVGNAWNFDGTNQYVDLGTNVGNFGSNDFTIDLWVKESATNATQSLIEKREDCGAGTNNWSLRTMGSGAGLGCPSFELSDSSATNSSTGSTNRIDDGYWHHLAVTRKGVCLMLFVDGVFSDYALSPSVVNISNTAPIRVGTNVCIGSDGSVPLKGQVDEVDFFHRALSPSEINAIYQAGALGKYSPFSPLPNAQLVLNDVTNNIVGNDTVWKTNSIVFTATTNVTRIELIGSAMSPLLDSIMLEELANTNYGNYFLAEESLDAFKDEIALGYWTLDLWDTRTGMASTNNSLLSWELLLTYSSDHFSMVTLTNRVVYTNTIASDSIIYFAIDVPTAATFATNMLDSITGGPLTLLYNQTGLPTGNLPGDAFLIQEQVQGTNIMNTTSLPVLVPGQRYFLGVVNLNSSPQDFRLEVDFDVTTNIDVIVLTNGIAFATNNWGTNGFATNVVTTNYQYFAFDISTNANTATFEVFDMTNDLDLVVAKGLPLPSLGDFDYLSSNPGTNNEIIFVATNSTPMPLTPGRWYLGVYAYASTNLTSYKVRATLQTPPTAQSVMIITESAEAKFASSWTVIPNMKYEISFTPDLSAPFTPLATNKASGTTLIYTDPTPVNGLRQGYYRLRLLGTP